MFREGTRRTAGEMKRKCQNVAEKSKRAFRADALRKRTHVCSHVTTHIVTHADLQSTLTVSEKSMCIIPQETMTKPQIDEAPVN